MSERAQSFNMNGIHVERVQALRSKLPKALLSIIASYDSHATADLIRSLHFRELPATGVSPPRKLISTEKPTYFVQQNREIQRRRLQNVNRHLTSHVWLRIFGGTYSWMLYFETWRFGTNPDIDYLSD